MPIVILGAAPWGALFYHAIIKVQLYLKCISKIHLKFFILGLDF